MGQIGTRCGEGKVDNAFVMSYTVAQVLNKTALKQSENERSFSLFQAQNYGRDENGLSQPVSLANAGPGETHGRLSMDLDPGPRLEDGREPQVQRPSNAPYSRETVSSARTPGALS
jgi:hypothetical protein